MVDFCLFLLSRALHHKKDNYVNEGENREQTWILIPSDLDNIKTVTKSLRNYSNAKLLTCLRSHEIVKLEKFANSGLYFNQLAIPLSLSVELEIIQYKLIGFRSFEVV